MSPEARLLEEYFAAINRFDECRTFRERAEDLEWAAIEDPELET